MNGRRAVKVAAWAPMIGLWAAVALVAGHAGSNDQASALDGFLRGPVDLAGPRLAQTRYYRFESQVVQIGFDGRRTGIQTYVLKLKCVPASLAGKPGDEYTCRSLTLQADSEKPAAIPALAGWTYVFKDSPTGADEAGQVLGIPHAKFEGLVDDQGRKIAPAVSYLIYNNFIDFHSFNDILSRPTPEGKGVQDLTRIGQRIVHSAAFTSPAVNLGTNIKPGSFFKNGEITMELKGLGLVDGSPCALVGYDSGESTLKMIVSMSPKVDIVTEGGSEYAGDFWIDLSSCWMRRMALNEFVVTRTSLPGGGKMDSYIVRHLTIRLISAEEYGMD